MDTSIITRNAVPTRQHQGWYNRLYEVEVADIEKAKALAGHHFSRFFDERLDAVRMAIEKRSRLILESKRKKTKRNRQQIRDAAGGIFQSCDFMCRLYPGVATITKVAGGTLPRDLRGLYGRMWQLIKRMEVVRQRFYARANRSSQKHGMCISREIGDLCNELEACGTKFYSLAKTRYGLPALSCWGWQ